MHYAQPVDSGTTRVWDYSGLPGDANLGAGALGMRRRPRYRHLRHIEALPPVAHQADEATWPMHRQDQLNGYRGRRRDSLRAFARRIARR
jgi:hypothetical protein